MSRPAAQDTQKKAIERAVEKTLTPRTFLFTISDSNVDRQGDIIDPLGWQLEQYRRNPVVLFGHRHDILPIAKSPQIGLVNGVLKAIAEFPPPSIYPLADQTHDLVAAGFLKGSSVGFLALEREYNATRHGYDIKKAELCEWSIVNVGANAGALIESSLSRRCNEMALKGWFGIPIVDTRRVEQRDFDAPMGVRNVLIGQAARRPAQVFEERGTMGMVITGTEAREVKAIPPECVSFSTPGRALVRHYGRDPEILGQTVEINEDLAQTVRRKLRKAVQEELARQKPAIERAIRDQIARARGRVD